MQKLNRTAHTHMSARLLLFAGWYGVPEGLVFSFPVKFIKPGQYEVLDDFRLTSHLQSKLDDLIEVN